MILFLTLFLAVTAAFSQIDPCSTYSCDSTVIEAILDSNSIDDSTNPLEIKVNGAGRIISIEGRIRGLITTIPESIGRLEKLEHLELWRNNISELPEEFGQLARLTYLNLGGNKIAYLPESFTQLANLERLYLHQNNLMTLPESMVALHSLKEIDVSNNILCTLSSSLQNWLDSLSNPIHDWRQAQYCPREIDSTTRKALIGSWLFYGFVDGMSGRSYSVDTIVNKRLLKITSDSLFFITDTNITWAIPLEFMYTELVTFGYGMIISMPDHMGYVFSVSDTSLTLAQNAYDGQANFYKKISESLSVNEERENSEDFHALTVMPNPFNPATAITIHLVSREVVSVAIYNAQGDVVSSLMNGKMYEPGAHTVNFNAHELPSGIYICKLTAGRKSYAQRMMLVR